MDSPFMQMANAATARAAQEGLDIHIREKDFRTWFELFRLYIDRCIHVAASEGRMFTPESMHEFVHIEYPNFLIPRTTNNASLHYAERMILTRWCSVLRITHFVGSHPGSCDLLLCRHVLQTINELEKSNASEI